MKKRSGLVYILLSACLLLNAQIRPSAGRIAGDAENRIYVLENDLISFQVRTWQGKIMADSLFALESWQVKFHSRTWTMTTDGGFELEVMWTDWRAPGKAGNGDNLLRLGKDDFKVIRHSYSIDDVGNKGLKLFLANPGIPFRIILCYSVNPGAWWVRKHIELSDTASAVHFLQSMSPLHGRVTLLGSRGQIPLSQITFENKGGFGQPIALSHAEGGAFLGLEYPASENICHPGLDFLDVTLQQQAGWIITAEPGSSRAAVLALTPPAVVQSWFYDYLDDIRVAPADPYTLYNSWYDLRSPEYPGVGSGHVMNEKNVLSIADMLYNRMQKQYGITLDAFVLDDGWDVYESDWQLRSESFPDGLKPLADHLKKRGTALGIWYGPTGGYSFRMKRVEWMKKQGYEVVGQGRNHAMLCLGGSRYGKLFSQRVTSNVLHDGVSYFKWDGIQFSCSETDHGHPPGIYSRTAILNSLIGQCRAVRSLNPATYLNITSGTWLSPWWLAHANQIWMDGGDYGFSSLPSLTRREASVTYRDGVLFDNFHRKNLWFPVSNLMTHGIIKGKVESVGGEYDPLHKFADDVVMYVGRGISMYELYVSPGLVSDAEWKVMADALRWGRDNHHLMRKTFMRGGDPAAGESYAYLHFSGKQGIIAARNPGISSEMMPVKLDPCCGLDPDARGLVLEKIYPWHEVHHSLLNAGDTAMLVLDALETAVYRIYPLSDAPYPLPAGLRFDIHATESGNWLMKVHTPNPHAHFLNPGTLKSMQWNGKTLASLRDLPMPREVPDLLLTESPGDGSKLNMGTWRYRLREDAGESVMSLLFIPDTSLHLPELVISVDGMPVDCRIESEKGAWDWVSFVIPPGEHKLGLALKQDGMEQVWQGQVSVWGSVQYPAYFQEITMNPVIPAKAAASLPDRNASGFHSAFIFCGKTNGFIH
ncbi:MAG TPA: alpha-galactosidase [Bacteroidales bacterium]|nr:alpha-galactosidase [Bacteroidales bacterium]HSA43980.1 alpha-galactosidase [Bacteroidales bacterium]